MVDLALGALVVTQVLCLVIGTVQGFRYFRTDPFLKAIPWLLVAMMLGPLLVMLARWLR